ncbi:hypothetical protein [Methylobacterium flocculans]|uniref:hypothetical protein n=1 Tax=Methylobacterium flocculans TaxID=2984843 RepID=UPI0021F28BC2|nr:hypothetical protein [Methylobacterium sp. FF17]
MREKLTELLGKVEAAKEPDRRLDYEVFAAFAVPGEANPWDPKDGHLYTSSVDAALGLAERVAPRSIQWAEILREATTVLSRRYGWHCNFSRPGQLQELPLAILGSLLTALLVQTEASDGR